MSRAESLTKEALVVTIFGETRNLPMCARCARECIRTGKLNGMNVNGNDGGLRWEREYESSQRKPKRQGGMC